MAKKLKEVETEEPGLDENQQGLTEPISIPDIPAQMEEKKASNTVEHTDVVETEVNFLKRILYIQESGGFGKHLDKLINDRIKTLT